MSNIIKKDKWGRPLNEKGQIIDKFGRPIFDENGKMIPYPEARFYMDTGARAVGRAYITEEAIKSDIEFVKKTVTDLKEQKRIIEEIIKGAKEANEITRKYFEEKEREDD